MHTDNGSVEEYLYLVHTWMKDTLSTVAVEQDTGNLVGFLVCRFNEIHNRDPEFSKDRVTTFFSSTFLVSSIYICEQYIASD